MINATVAVEDATRRPAHLFSARELLAMMGIFSFLLVGCGEQLAPVQQPVAQDQPSKPLAGPPEVTSEEEEGFHDLVFYIQEHKRLPDGSQNISALGTHKGRQLGFEVLLGATWQSGSLGKGIPIETHRGNVTYRSTGPDSDAFIQVLDELYGTKLSPKEMGRETQFNGISLEGDPGDLAKGPARIKLFFESDKEEAYAELFTNIELAAHRLEFREKDEGYRSAVIKALQAH
jgi:hypothetical protein